MAQATTLCPIGSPPKPFNGKGENAIAFWNLLENYYSINNDVYRMVNKKITAAYTHFKVRTQARDWASNYMAIALATTPTTYEIWDDFQDAFKVQFIPPQTQLEAIGKVHSLHIGNQEFNEWY
jgi:hypothetical protein